MKKKIIGIFTILCLIFPCFFAVACKDKEESKFEPYAYTVTLKNAYGKIDETTLSSEYDHNLEKPVGWTKENNDYKISVTRTSHLSGNLAVSLLEGYDFSSLTFTVNGAQTDFSIKSGSLTDCATKAYLKDRQFNYNYEKMSADTSLVLDFSNCGVAKVTLDVSKLKNYDLRYCVIEDDFVTMAEGESLLTNDFDYVQQDSLVVDYGTIIAFDYSDRVVLTDSLNQIQNLSYSTYGLRYLMTINRIQYLSANIDGTCDVYLPTTDPENKGTLRVLGNGAGLNYANSYYALEDKSYSDSNQEFEYFDNEMLTMSIFNGTTFYIELDEDAQQYNYYLVDKLDDEWFGSIQQKTIPETDRVYIEVDLKDSSGDAGNAKYLVRKAKIQNNFYITYANNTTDGTRVTNADYILIGEENKPFGISGTIEESIFYCFLKDKDARVAIPSLNIDKKTNIGQVNLGVEITAQNIGSMGENLREAALVSVDPATVSTVTIDCYSSTDSTRVYRLDFYYDQSSFDENHFAVSTDELHLYDGENFYYTTTPTDASSWKKLTNETTLELYSGEGKSLYYYVDSNRADAYLNLENLIGEKISSSGEFVDCFGRLMQGTAEVDGVKIDLSRLRYLEITPGYYNYSYIKLLRAYDETFHDINVTAADDMRVKISMENYTSEDDFVELDEMSELAIRYTGYELPGEIYYYVDNFINYELVLKTKKGEVVSTSELVYYDDEPVMVNNRYVYCLSLNAGYYAENQLFYMHIVEASYTIADEGGNVLSFYTSDDGNEETKESDLFERVSYFITCEDAYRVDIYDEAGGLVIAWENFTAIPKEVGGVPVYLFTFTIPDNTNYLPGTQFTLVKSAR